MIKIRIRFALSIYTVIALCGCSAIEKTIGLDGDYIFKDELNKIIDKNYLTKEERNKIEVEKAEMLKERAEKEQEKERKQAVATERFEKQMAENNTIRMAAIEERNKALERDKKMGYRHMAVQDFKLDAKGMHESSKVALTGYYTLFGKIERISDIPTRESFGNKVAIITKNADRDSRKLLLSNFACQQVYCPVTILGKIGQCQLSILGRKSSDEICIIVDAVRENYSQ